ncbi:hypothetical protein [Tenacibaculum xiamenense]|uniref:hypothetical protein n=1 Tax=Tenacibaculum xiamenense TaxID=1261553 RepID=UPI003893FEAC
MSEIGDIIKKIASSVDVVNTFPAIVTAHGVIEEDNKKKYTISVRKLITSNPEMEYLKLQAKLDSTYISEDLKNKVLSSDESNRKYNPIEYHDVRLKSVVNGIEEGIILVPRIGSWVLVSLIDNITAHTYVSQYSEVDRVILRLNNMKDTNGGQKKPEEFVDINLSAGSLQLKYGDSFHTQISKEQLTFDFLYPKEDSDSDQKKQSTLSFSKDKLQLNFMDKEAKEVFKSTFDSEKVVIQTGDEKKKVVLSSEKGINLISDTDINIKGKTVNIEGTEAINLN